MPLADMKGIVPLGQGADAAFVGLAVGQTTLTTGATTILAANGKRAKVFLHNTSTQTTVYVSSATDVTSGDGFGIIPGSTQTWEFVGPLYGVSANSVVISWAELG